MPDNLYRRGATWYARTQVRGRDIRRSLHTASLSEARKRLKGIIQDLEHLRHHGEDRATWQAATLDWAEDAPRSLKSSTFERYRTSLAQAGRHLDNLYLDEITHKTIAKIAGRKTTNATRRRDLTAVSAVLRYAVAQGWIDSNPAATWDRSVIREKREPITPPTDADLARLIAVCPSGFRDCVAFLAATGMRQNEAVTLEWPQVDLKRGEVTLTRTKTNRPRVVPLSAAARKILAARPRHITRHIVFHHDGLVYKNFASRFVGYAKRAGVAFRCHDLRHKFAVDYLKDGGDVYRLKEILGHSSVKTTEIYLGYVGNTPAQKPAHGNRFGTKIDT